MTSQTAVLLSHMSNWAASSPAFSGGGSTRGLTEIRRCCQLLSLGSTCFSQTMTTATHGDVQLEAETLSAKQSHH